MILEEAIKEASSRPRNVNLQFYVCKWNDGYCINQTSHMLRHPDEEYVWSTEILEKQNLNKQ
jgi:hypothetical protein